MSDAKPKRTGRESGRESGRSDIAPGEAAPPETTPIIVPEAVPDALAAAPAIVAEPAPQEAAAAVEPMPAAMDDAWTAFAEMQAALARSFEEIAVEMTGMTQSGIAATADAATAMLGARTFAEAVEINAGLVRRRADAMIEGSTRLSEIGVKAVTQISRPFLSRFGAAWSGAGLG